MKCLISEPKKLSGVNVSKTIVAGADLIREAYDTFPELAAYAKNRPVRLIIDYTLAVASIAVGPFDSEESTLLFSIRLNPTDLTVVAAIDQQLVANSDKATKH